MGLEYIGLTAAFAALAGAWGHFKNIFDRIRSLVIVTATMNNGHIKEALQSHLWDKYKSSPFSYKKYTVSEFHVKSLGGRNYVPFESPPDVLTLFNGIFPFFIKR